jgi:hypothetical protein
MGKYLNFCLTLIASFLISYVINNSGGGETVVVGSEVPNEHGDCSTVPHPHNSSECFAQTTSHLTCCYVEYTDESTHEHVSTCQAFDYNYNFASAFIDKINISGHTVDGHVTCNLATHSQCGQADPTNESFCRQHSDAVKNSCCMFTSINGTSNCILSNKKMNSTNTNYTLINMLGNIIQCSANKLSINVLLMFVMLMIFLFL